jgi:hypothetical protein
MKGGLLAFQYIAVSPLGLRESDLVSLLGPEWDPTVFLRITYYFDAFFVQNPNTLCWHIKSTRLKNELIAGSDIQQVYKDLSKHLVSLPDSDFLKHSIFVYISIKAHCPPESIPILGSRDHFSDYDDVANWFFWASSILEADEGLIDDLESCCDHMTDSQQAIFLRHFFAYGCGFCQQVQAHLTLVRSQLMQADISTMDSISAFDLAWMMTEADLYIKYIDNQNLEEREAVLKKAIYAFKRTLELEPTHKAAKNMITAAGTALMDLYIQEGRFEEFNQLYNSLK